MLPSEGFSPTQQDDDALPVGPSLTDGGGQATASSRTPTPFVLSTGGHSTFEDVPERIVEFRPGQVIAGQFQIVRVLGRGGMGIVYEAEDRLTRQRVALKAILPTILSTPQAAERFVQEVNTARRLRHPGIVAVYDVRQEGGLLFFTMEYVEGRTLRQILDKQHKLPLGKAVGVVHRLCRALEYAHRYTVHRDISPENVMVTADGAVRLLDFGIAKATVPSQVSAVTAPLGKVHYMAPEQREDPSQADAQADIFSLGVMVFEMLTGELPSGYNSLTELFPGLSAEWEDMVGKALAHKEIRYKTVREFRLALESCYEATRQAHGASDAPASGASTEPRPATSGAAQPPFREKTAGAIRSLVPTMVDAQRRLRIPVRIRLIRFRALPVARLAVGALRRLRARVRIRRIRLRTLIQVGALALFVSLLALLWIPGFSGPLDGTNEGASESKLAAAAAPEEAAPEAPAAEVPPPNRPPKNPTQATRLKNVPLGADISLNLLWIEGSIFNMGSQDGSTDEKPVHPVTVDGFWIGEREVTQAQWQAVMGQNPSRSMGQDLPVEQVSWKDCQAFIEKLNQRGEGRFRLPTEAEWEYACRAGSANKYCSGDDEAGLSQYGWYEYNSELTSHPVGGKAPNAFGLYDMHGNVAEWCQDPYRSYSNQARPETTPSDSGYGRVVRGGSWAAPAEQCRSAYRHWDSEERRSAMIGFRIVREP